MLDLFIVLMVFLIVVVVAAFLRHESRQRTPFWDPFEDRNSVSRVGDLPSVAAFPDMLRRDRERWGMGESQAAWRFGVSRPEYRELEAGTRLPTFETWDRICKLYGWPQTFIEGFEPPRSHR